MGGIDGVVVHGGGFLFCHEKNNNVGLFWCVVFAWLVCVEERLDENEEGFFCGNKGKQNMSGL